MNDKGLGDSWRMINPSSREYSYFYPLHHSSSWTDLFLISTSLTQNIHNNKMNPITISGHAPVSLSINIQTQIKPPMRWCSNTSLLQDLTEELVSFLQMNDSPEISPWLLWETVIKGKIISYSSYKKKQPKQRIEQLTNFCSNNPTEQIRKEPQNPTWQNLKQKNAILNPTTQIWNLSIGQQNREIFSKSTTTQKRKSNNYHNYRDAGWLSSRHKDWSHITLLGGLKCILKPWIVWEYLYSSETPEQKSIQSYNAASGALRRDCFP